MDILGIVVSFVVQNVVGLAAGAVLGWVIPQPTWAGKLVSFVAPFVNRGFAFGKAIVDKFRSSK